MSIVKVVFLGVVLVVVASVLKQYKPEFSLYFVIASSFFLFSLLFADLKGLLGMYQGLEDSIGEYKEYMGILVKVIGITYLCELSGGICKDAGYQTLASQVELCGKVSIFLLGMPILMMLIEQIRGLFI